MRPRRRSPRAFTLVELLAVITILGILVALLVPALWGAYRRARYAQAQSQVDVLAFSLADFRVKFGDVPGSRLILHESGHLGTPPADAAGYYAGMPSDHPNIGGRPGIGPAPGTQEFRDLVGRSVTALKRAFPKVHASTTAHDGVGPTLAPAPQGFYDFNGNGRFDPEPILLDGHECLFFFLCGVADWEEDASGTWHLRGAGGFSLSGRNPFTPVPATGPDDRRTKPHFEITSPSQLSDDDQDGMPGILDPLGVSSDARYVAYFAPYGRRYDPRDVQLEPSSVATFTLPDEGGITIAVPGPNPWCTGPGAGPGLAAPAWLRRDSFQLVSPGLDRLYGPGGTVETAGESWSYPGADRTAEEDNAAIR